MDFVLQEPPVLVDQSLVPVVVGLWEQDESQGSAIPR